jgi:uncharacterized protein (DUF2252 family)
MTGIPKMLKGRADRFRQGKILRSEIPRELHADFRCRPDRDAVGILVKSDKGRLPELLPERYKRMSQDAFAFYRGSAAIMAYDLSSAPKAGIAVQACGDSHIMNFGAFASPEDNIFFNVDDFDETLPGVDFTYDVKRLAASVALAARVAGLGRKLSRSYAAAAITAYHRHMYSLAAMSPLEAWNNHTNLERELELIKDRALLNNLKQIVARARGRGLEKDDNFPHLIRGGDMRIEDKPPLIFHVDPSVIDPQGLFENYRRAIPSDRLSLLERYELKDLAFKAVGVGSVGAYCFIGLFESGDADPLFLQVKEARRSVLEGVTGAPYVGHQGRRVIEGQRVMQTATDIFLGCTEDVESGREFYIRRLKSRHLGSFSDIAESQALDDYARLCGRTLARAHARSGDPATISGYMGKSDVFDDVIASFAMLYADRTILDHAAFVKGQPLS